MCSFLKNIYTFSLGEGTLLVLDVYEIIQFRNTRLLNFFKPCRFHTQGLIEDVKFTVFFFLDCQMDRNLVIGAAS